MSVSEYLKRSIYIVTVKNAGDLDNLYFELETAGVAPINSEILRAVQCLEKRPSSRSTVYELTKWEADQLRRDNRIKSVELAPSELGIQAGEFSTTQTSSAWDKSTSESSSMKNWGLLRCTEGSQRTGWGGTGYEGDGSGTASQTGTISLTQTGRNVDVVIVDGNGIVFGHPEYAVNADGTGGQRSIQYNWGQHDPAVKGTSASNYVYSVSDHATHVAGTTAGNTQGWARNANIYNIYYYAGAVGDNNFPYVMDYVREFHRTKSVNPTTGRKNPTITNNSWGMSIFPGEWSLSDITAVTYRGTRYTPGASTPSFTGFSGVCTANEKLAELAGFENFGNRIVTTGPYTPPIGSILTKPESWTQEGQQAFLNIFEIPDTSYQLTIDGPGDLNLLHNVAIDAVSGNISLTCEIIITDSSDNEVFNFIGTDSTENGGTVEVVLDEVVNLLNDEVYTVTYNTTVTASQAVDLIYGVDMVLTVVTETNPASATVTEITNNLTGGTFLTSSTTPTSGNNDDGFWQLTLPFDVQFLGTNYSSIYVGTNSYITFGSGSSVYSGLSATTPNLPKIMWCASDRSVQRIYYGTQGSTPNRTYRVRVEAHSGFSGGILGSPTMVAEYTFYENAPSQIDMQLGTNAAKLTTGGFTTNQLTEWGFISGQRIPVRVAALDADIEDAIDEGIIYVGAAGNGRWKHDVPGGPDWDNTFEMANRYPGSVSQPYYYMRGTSPTANDTTDNGGYDIPNICVGSVDTIQVDQKVLYSDCGPGVDIWAPGTYIISALPFGVVDPRNAGFSIGKFSGTSMASPQVCGVIACALEIYPHWKQEDAKAYITAIAKANQLVESNGGPGDAQDLQDAPNLFLYYKKEREVSGNVFPKINYQSRPATGAVWPRRRIRQTL